MGDGGCAVLSSRFPLAEFGISEACRKEVKGTRNWATELVSFVGLAPNLERTDDEKSCLWASVGFSTMEPGRSTRIGESGEEDYKRRRRHSSTWVEDNDDLLPSVAGPIANPDGTSNELTKSPDQGSTLTACHVGSGPGKKQRVGTEESGKPGVESNWTKSHLTSGRDVVGESKSDSMNERDRQIGKGHFEINGNVDSRNQHRRNSGRSKYYDVVGGETFRGTSLTGHSGSSHPRKTREGNDKDSGTRSHPREHSTSSSHHASEREVKEKKDCGWNHNDSLHSSSRSGRRGKENGVEFSRCTTASDRHLDKDDVCRHHSERDSHGNRRHHPTRDRPYESGSRSGHIESSNHRDSSERLAGRSSCSDKSHSSHRRDLHSRSWSITDKNDVRKKNYDHSGGRNHSGRKNDRYHREQWNWTGHTEDRTNLDEKRADVKGNYLESSSAAFHSPVTTCQDDSRSVGMDVPMDLSPAPAHDSAGMCSELTWVGAVDPGWTEDTGVTSASLYTVASFTGWIYIDYEGNTQGPVELKVLKCLLEDGKLQPDHMVKLDGTNEWVTLEHARSPSASCVGAGPLPLRRSEILSQPPQPPQPPERDDRQWSPFVHVGNAGDENQTSSSHISDLPEGCQIDKRVEQLMEGFTLVPGREKEIISEALNHAARHVHLENEQELENEESPQIHSGLAAHWKEDQLISDGHSFGSFGLEAQPLKEPAARTGDESGVNADGIGINSFQSARKWTSRGGDWVLASSIENFQTTKAHVSSERLGKEKVVLNGSIPLCESRHSGLPDPRKGSQQFSSLEASKKRAFALPPWAYRFWDVKSQCLETSHENSGQVNQPLEITSKILSSTLKSQASTFPVQIMTPRGGAHSEGTKKIQAAKANMDPEQNIENTMKGFSGTEQSQISKGDFAANYVQLPSTALDISAEQSGKVRVCEDPSVCLATCDIGDSNSQLSRCDVSLPRLDELGGDHAKPLQVLSRKEDLRLEEGDWYYKDGAGREMGPFSYAQLQAKVQRGSLHGGSSVYRKSDETWVPIYTHSVRILDGTMANVSSHEFCVDSVSKEVEWNTKEDHASHCHDDPCSFQQVYPQFIGYMRGTLHEYVMKSYKNRDFPAMLEGSEKWLNDKQSRTTVEASMALHCPLTVSATEVPAGAVSVPSQNSSTRSTNGTLESREDMNKFDVKHRESDMPDLMSVAVMTTSGFSSVQSFPQPIHALPANDLEHPKNRRAGKRKFLLDIEDVHGKLTCSQGAIHSEFKTCVSSPEVYTLNPMVEANDSFPVKTVESAITQDWGTIEPHLLMKVFSFLEIDVRSLILASATCKAWRVALDQFKREIKEIDLSSLGSLCSDAVFHSFTEHAHKLSRVILRGCTMLSSSAVKTFLQEHSSISTVDANGCDQLKEVVQMFPHVSWISSKSKLRHQHGTIESHRKFQSLKLIPERGTLSSFKHVERLDAHSSDDSNCKDGRSNIEDMHSDVAIEPMDCDPPHSLDRDSGTSQITRSNQSTKRTKLSNVGKFAKIGPDGLHHRVVLRECAIVGSHVRDKEQVLTPEGKHKQKSVYLVGNAVNAQLPSTDKHALVISKGDPSFAIDRFKNLEKSFAQILRTIKDADTHKIFFRQVSDSKEISYMTGWTSAFSSIEEKVREGLYQGNKGGLREFKDDLFTSCRKAFRSGKQGTYLKAGQDMFRLTYRLISQLEENLKTPASCKDVSRSQSSKRKYYDHQSGPALAGRKRETGDVMGKQGLSKRKRGLDEGSADDESEDYFLDKEGRRSYNHKRDYWKESETETSGTDEDDENLFQDEEEEETDDSELEAESQSGEEGGIHGGERDSSEDDVANHEECVSRIWGARMTKASMVPPVTRKYELIEEYVIVADMAEVNKRMTVNLPDDYNEKLQAAQEKYSHLEMPELKEYRPRKRVQDEVLEQEVYGIDPYTHNLLMDTMPSGRSDFTDARRHQLIEEDLLKALNLEVRQFTGSGKAPNKYLLEPVIERLVQENTDVATRTFCAALLRNMRSRLKDKYVAYRKGLGVVCRHKTGFEKDEFIVEFFGEVYPAWRWFEKQDAIRSLQKKDKDPAPEFYNIFLERPKGDVLGYDLVVVDAMHKANYASRICHSCRPNCEARVTAVNGRYQIGVYTLRPVQYGEELTFDYNSITESKEEYEASVCLCGSQGCRGSYLCFAGPGAFQEVMKDCHGLLHRHDLLLKACMAGHVSRKDWDDLWQAGLGSCLLEGLPDWTIGYAAEVVRFMNNERKSLPKEILKSIIKERCLETYGDSEALEAEIQADGVFNSRVQNLAITLDKVRYAFKTLYGDPKTAPPPLRRLEPTELVSLIWKNENSVVAELLRGMAYHGSKDALLDFKRKVRDHEPVESGDVEKNLQESLLWLRDELCKAPTACLSRHDAAADVIHMYAYTKLFFTSQDYAPFESPCLSINHLDLGPKHAHALGTASSHEWSKSYSKDYVLGQLIFWYNQNAADPGSSLVKAQRGCLVLPDLMSCYAKSGQQNPRLGYGSRHRMEMFRRMEQKPQRQWSRQEFWEFKSNRRLFGSPMMDAIWQRTSVNRQTMDWLKKRTLAFVGPWDNQ